MLRKTANYSTEYIYASRVYATPTTITAQRHAYAATQRVFRTALSKFKYILQLCLPCSLEVPEVS